MAERYEIRGKIARGGIGAIYRAHDTVMGREVAIKRLLPLEETHLNEAQDDSLKREAAALAQFQHPNVVTIFAFESDADGPYVVMEMVEGETLKEAVERAALPVEDFIELTQQILDPLVSAKELNLLHRDIKPANIMLTWLASGRFQIKVLDFGLAKFSQQPSLQTLDQTGSFLGSIDYLAPEQLELHPLDQRTDLYSLGCVLYYTLAQHPPFEGDNAARTMQNHLSHRVTHLSEIREDVPPAIAAWVMRLISRHPAERPADALAALREFHAARLGEPAAEEEIPLAIVVPEEPLPVALRVVETPASPAKVQLHVPKTGSAPVKGRTQPQLVMPPGSSPVKPKRGDTEGIGSKRRVGGSAPVSPATGGPVDWLREHPVAALAAAGAVILGLVLAFRGGDDEGPAAAPQKAPAQTTAPQPAPAAPATPPMPALKNPAIAQPRAVAPAVTEGLIAHFAASDAVLGADFATPVKAGERVGLWGNLAPGAAADHLLAVEPQNRGRGPLAVTVTPAEWPELAGPTTLLRFDRSTRLIAYGNAAIAERLQGTGMTAILVLRPERERGPVLRFDSDSASPFLAWDMTPAGYATRMAKGTLAPTIEARLGATRNRLLVVSHVWEGEKVEQRLHVTLSSGYQALVAAGDAPFKPQTVQRYSLGAISTDPNANTFEGLVAEWLLYDRALPDAERRQVETQLAKKYLNPAFAMTIDSATPQPNGVVAPPRNPAGPAAGTLPPPAPAAELLVAHFAAGSATVGHDLIQPAVAGQRVMAWGNVAPGTNPDHLLAYQGGHDGRTPLLRAAADGIPGLKPALPTLQFAPGDTLEAKGGGQASAKMDDLEFSGYLVASVTAESGSLLQFKTATASPALEIEARPDGFAAAMLAGGGKQVATLAAPRAGAVIIGFDWRAADKTHRIWVVQADGTRSAPAVSESPVATLPVDGYRLGKADGTGAAQVAALLLYGKALDETQQRAVEAYLGQLYLDPAK
jgi:serine/threonine protein kinase